AQGKGHYFSISTTPAGSTFDWKISVVPPQAKAAGNGFTIALTDISANVNLMGAQKVSAPLSIPIGSALFGAVAATPFKPSDGFCAQSPTTSPDAACGPNPMAPAGKVERNVEIRGWVTNRPGFDDRKDDDPANPPEEGTFNVLLDWGWIPDPLADAAGIHAISSLADIDALFTPHNVIRFGVGADKVGEEGNHHAQLSSDGRVWGGPGGMGVHVEIDGWWGGGRK